MRVFNQKRWFNSPSNNLFPPPHKIKSQQLPNGPTCPVPHSPYRPSIHAFLSRLLPKHRISTPTHGFFPLCCTLFSRVKTIYSASLVGTLIGRVSFTCAFHGWARWSFSSAAVARLSQVALALALACSAGTLSAVLVEGMFWGPIPGRAERVRFEYGWCLV